MCLWGNQTLAQTAPRVTSIVIDDGPSNGEAFVLGERIDIFLDFDEAVEVDHGNTPQLALQIGAETRYADLWYNWGPHLRFLYIVQAQDRDADGISIPANALMANGESITLASDPSVGADLSHDGVAADQRLKVDGSIASAPTIESVNLQSEPLGGDTYGPGEGIEVSVHFDKSLTITGEPRLMFQIGTETRASTYWRTEEGHGSRRSALTFRYTVQPDDMDGDGVSIPANALSVVGGEITLLDRPDIDADLSHEEIADNPMQKVDGSIGPRVTSIVIDDSPSSGDTFRYGERIDVLVHFDRAVGIDWENPPRVALQIGTRTRYASYWYHGSYIHFTYVVTAEDRDTDGISIPANAMAADGASVFLASDRSVVADLSHEAVAADPQHKVDGSLVRAPGVETIFFQGGSSRGDVYGLGDRIVVGVHFDTSVTVTGEPQLRIQIGEHIRMSTSWVQNDTHGSKLTFSYTVQADDRDADGASIPANALSVEGGTITLRDRDDLAADLSHPGVDDDPARRVDGSLAPAIERISLVGGPDNGHTYTLGEAIRVLVEFDERVNLDSRLRLAIAVGSRARQAWRTSASYADSFVFEYVVRPADLDSDGVSIPGNSLTLNGAPATLNLDHDAVAADPNHKVDGSVAVAPVVMGVTVNTPRRYGDNGVPEYPDTYGVGEEITVSVEFDKSVDVTGARPEVALAIGERTRPARLLPNRSATGRFIRFFYVVQSDDMDDDGIAIPANALTLNGGSITILGDANTDAVLSHDAVAVEHRVDGETVSAPRNFYRWIWLAGSPLNGRTYGLGERIWPYMWLDRRPAVSGEPALSLRIGGENRSASFFPGATYNAFLSFEYLVQKDDLDLDGFGSPPNAVSLNGGAIVSAGSADIAADLANGVVDFGYAVDGSLVSAPKVSRTSILGSPTLGGTYGLGDRIGPTVCFDLPVEVKGEPRLALDIGGRTSHAFHADTYARSGSETCLFFWYTVQAEDLDRDGISIPANALDLNGGAITLEVDEGIAADPSHEALEDDGDHRVDGTVAVAPTVTSVSFVGAPATGGPYQAGDVVTVRVGFDRALAVSGEPRLALAVGSRRRHASYAGQTTVRLIDVPNLYKRNFFSLSFEYTVQPGDMDSDGISIPANALDLNGGSLALMGVSGTAADLSHSAVNPDETRLVDAPDTAPTFSTAIAGQVWVVNQAVSLELPAAVGDGALTYSLLPEPPAGMTFDAETRLLSGMPLALVDRMAFRYTVTDGDEEDPESTTLAFSMSVVAQSAREVGARSVGDDSVEVAWRGQWSEPSRGRLVIEARSPAMDWTVVGTVDPSSGEFTVRGLEPETPHTFRLRFESAGSASRRSGSAQSAPEYSEEFSVTTGSYTGPCRSGGKYLCLRGGRFELRADWTNPDRAGDFGAGTAVPVDVSAESGLFWFFSPANIELVTKVLDGSSLNGYYWMFFGALSDVEYWLTLRDTAAGGLQRTYHNPPKEVCGQSDTRAFPGDLASLLGLSSSVEASSGPAPVEPVRLSAVPLAEAAAPAADSAGRCESTSNRLCLLEDRFAIDVNFIDPNISDPDVDPESAATVAPSLGTANTGFFWFFNQENIELAVKVLDGRGINGKFWLLYGALSDVEYEITVADTVTGESKTYRNEAGSVCGEVDSGAF